MFTVNSYLTQDPSVQDDILLEVVMLCGTFSLDEQCASLLVKAGLPDLLISILKGNRLKTIKLMVLHVCTLCVGSGLYPHIYSHNTNTCTL